MSLVKDFEGEASKVATDVKDFFVREASQAEVALVAMAKKEWAALTPVLLSAIKQKAATIATQIEKTMTSALADAKWTAALSLFESYLKGMGASFSAATIETLLQDAVPVAKAIALGLL